MNDAALVRGFQGIGNLPGDLHRLVHRQSAFGAQVIFERWALDQLHDECRGATGVLESMHLRDVGMVQAREHLRFTCEPRQAFRIMSHACGQHLESHVALEAGVASAINLPHSPLAERGLNQVRANGGSRGERHRRLTLPHQSAWLSSPG